MYAEERQQAMAELVDRARPRLGGRARRRSSTSPPRRSAATSSALERPAAWSAGCTAARSRPSSLTVLEAGLGDRDLANADAEGPDRQGAPSRCLPAGRLHACSSTPGTTTARLADAAPPRPPADRRHPRRPDRGPARRPRPTSSCTCCPAGSARPPRPRSGVETVAALARHPRRRRVHRHQRHLRRPRPVAPPTTTEAATKRAIVASAQQVVVLADSSKIGAGAHRALRRRSTTSTCSSPTTASPPPTSGGARGAPDSRWWSHDPHPHRPTPASTGPSPWPARSCAARCSGSTR